MKPQRYFLTIENGKFCVFDALKFTTRDTLLAIERLARCYISGLNKSEGRNDLTV